MNSFYCKQILEFSIRHGGRPENLFSFLIFAFVLAAWLLSLRKKDFFSLTHLLFELFSRHHHHHLRLQKSPQQVKKIQVILTVQDNDLYGTTVDSKHPMGRCCVLAMRGKQCGI